MSKKVKFHRQRYSKTEFDENLLPINRFRQFFDVIKIEWATLLRIGFLLLLFLLPLVAIGFFKPFISTSIQNGISNNGGTQDEIETARKLVDLIYYAATCVCFMVFSIGLAGVSQIFTNICYGEGVLFRNDFIKGIKSNWKRFLLFTFIGSLCFMLVMADYVLFSKSDNFMVNLFIFIPFFLLFLFIIPTMLFAMSNTICYKMTTRQCLSNGFKFACVKILFTLIFSAVMYGFTFIEKIKNPIIFTPILAVSIIIGFTLYYLAFHLFALYIKDEYINKEGYKEIYRKGLKPLI